MPAPSDKVYIVAGETGEYSGSTVWYVRAFLTEAEAGTFRDKLNDWCREKMCTSGRPWDHGEAPENPDDPDFQCDYTGTEYCVIGIELGWSVR